LHFALPEKADSAPFLTHNNKTIFFIVVDLYPYSQPASHRGTLRSIEITSDDLVTQIQEQNLAGEMAGKSWDGTKQIAPIRNNSPAILF
jgi:hypothetical protein